MSAQLVDGLELRHVVGPLVGDLGEDLLLDVLDDHPELHRRLIRVLGLRLEREDVADLGAAEVVVELVGDAAGADLVQVVVGLQPGDGLAIAAAVDRDRDVIGVDGRPVDGGQLAVLLAQALDLRVDLFVGGLGLGDLDAQARVARHRNRRPNLDDGVEGHGALVLARRDLELRRGDGVDFVFLDRLVVVGRQRLAQRLFPTDVFAQLGLEDAAGRLARPEARETDLLRDPPERGIDVLLELAFVDFDRELDLVALEGFDDGLHRGVSVPGDPVAPEPCL